MLANQLEVLNKAVGIAKRGLFDPRGRKLVGIGRALADGVLPGSEFAVHRILCGQPCRNIRGVDDLGRMQRRHGMSGVLKVMFVNL